MIVLPFLAVTCGVVVWRHNLLVQPDLRPASASSALALLFMLCTSFSAYFFHSALRPYSLALTIAQAMLLAASTFASVPTASAIPSQHDDPDAAPSFAFPIVSSTTLAAVYYTLLLGFGGFARTLRPGALAELYDDLGVDVAFVAIAIGTYLALAVPGAIRRGQLQRECTPTAAAAAAFVGLRVPCVTTLACLSQSAIVALATLSVSDLIWTLPVCLASLVALGEYLAIKRSPFPLASRLASGRSLFVHTIGWFVMWSLALVPFTGAIVSRVVFALLCVVMLGVARQAAEPVLLRLAIPVAYAIVAECIFMATLSATLSSTADVARMSWTMASTWIDYPYIPLAFQISAWALTILVRVAPPSPLLGRLFIGTLFPDGTPQTPALASVRRTAQWIGIAGLAVGVWMCVVWTRGVAPLVASAAAMIVAFVFAPSTPQWLLLPLIAAFHVALWTMLRSFGYFGGSSWHAFAAAAMFSSVAFSAGMLRVALLPPQHYSGGFCNVSWRDFAACALTAAYCTAPFTYGVPPFVAFFIGLLVALCTRQPYASFVAPLAVFVSLGVMLQLLRDGDHVWDPVNGSITRCWEFASLVGSAAFFLVSELSRTVHFTARQRAVMSPDAFARLQTSLREFANAALFAALVLSYVPVNVTHGYYSPPVVLVVLLRTMRSVDAVCWLIGSPSFSFLSVLLILSRGGFQSAAVWQLGVAAIGAASLTFGIYVAARKRCGLGWSSLPIAPRYRALQTASPTLPRIRAPISPRRRRQTLPAHCTVPAFTASTPPTSPHRHRTPSTHGTRCL